tara:strand:- start:752 stop:1159 length:408 start_codon:yes stop_codon:yes gene_type:complete
MKRFKEIRDGNSIGVGSTRQGRYQVDKTNPETIANINQAVNFELNKGYISPKNAIDNLRTKLNFVGFDFDSKEVPTSGSVTFPLKKATEVFGRGVEIDDFDVDFNDQSAISTGMNLTVSISQDESGLYKMTGKIS